MAATSRSPYFAMTSGYAIFAPGGPKGPQATTATYDLSFIAGCAGTNTYAVRCASGPWPCGENADVTTLTENLSQVEYTRQGITSGISTSVSESCTLSGQYSAACTAVVDISWSETKTHFAQTTVFAGGDEFMSNVYAVNITGGLAKMKGSLDNAVCQNGSGRAQHTLLFGVVVLLLVIGLIFI